MFTFTSNGSFTLNNTVTKCKCLIVGGGGAGGCNNNSIGGGGAGQVVVVSDISFSADILHNVTIGLGGSNQYKNPTYLGSIDASNVSATQSSIISSDNKVNLIAAAGGNAAYKDNFSSGTFRIGQDGGSGGGGGDGAAAGKSISVTNTSTVTYLGCSGQNYSSTLGPGGGGGATSVGRYKIQVTSTPTTTPNNIVTGGNGFTWELNGYSYGGGGGTYAYSYGSETNSLPGIGGNGGGGEGPYLDYFDSSYSINRTCSTTWGKPNTGGGGASAAYNTVGSQFPYFGRGGSGVVIIAIPKSNFSTSFKSLNNINYDYRQINSQWFLDYGYKISLYTFSDVSYGTYSSEVKIRNMYTNNYELNTINNYLGYKLLSNSLNFSIFPVGFIYSVTDGVYFKIPHESGYSRDFSMFARITNGITSSSNYYINIEITENNSPRSIRMSFEQNSGNRLNLFITSDDRTQSETYTSTITIANESILADVGFTVSDSNVFTLYNNKLPIKNFTPDRPLNINFFGKDTNWSITGYNVRIGPVGTYAKCLPPAEYKGIVTALK